MSVEVSQQTVCPNCEESVHRYAPRCPYCQHNLQLITTKDNNTSLSKITELQFGNLNISEEKDNNAVSHENPDHEENTQNSVKQLVISLAPLILLISGAFFFFFGLLIRFCSVDGTFTLQWATSSWLYFIIPACLCGLIGVGFLLFEDS